MKAISAFLIINVIAFLILPFVLEHPDLESYRPEGFEEGREKDGSWSVFKTIIWVTGVLLILKIVGIDLRKIIDFSVFSTAYLFGSLFGVGLPLALVLLSYRKSRLRILYNLSSMGTIIGFSLLFAPFLTPSATLLLFSLLSLYDVICVLYIPIIQFLWLRFEKLSKRYTRGVAILTNEGLIGAGDFAVPTLFALSFGSRGIFTLPFLFTGFLLTQRFARRFRTFPGLPIQAFFGALSYFILT